MSYEEYVKKHIEVPFEEKEPFCPFAMGYCNAAYSDMCYRCTASQETYREVIEGKRKAG